MNSNDPTGNVEVINRTARQVFQGTKNFDVAVYTDNSGQAIHLGCGSNPTYPSTIKVTNNSLNVTGDIRFSGNLLKNNQAFQSGTPGLSNANGVVYVLAGSNLGVGTSIPQQALDVKGAIAVGGVPRIAIDGGLSNVSISLSSIVADTLAVARGGTGSSTSTGTQGSAVVLGGSPTVCNATFEGVTNVTGHIVPTTNLSYDIGTSTTRFRDLYISGNTIDMGGTRITSDASNNIKVTDPSNNLRRIIVDEIQIGNESQGALRLKKDSRGSGFKFFDVNANGMEANSSRLTTAGNGVSLYNIQPQVTSATPTNGYSMNAISIPIVTTKFVTSTANIAYGSIELGVHNNTSLSNNASLTIRIAHQVGNSNYLVYPAPTQGTKIQIDTFNYTNNYFDLLIKNVSGANIANSTVNYQIVQGTMSNIATVLAMDTTTWVSVYTDWVAPQGGVLRGIDKLTDGSIVTVGEFEGLGVSFYNANRTRFGTMTSIFGKTDGIIIKSNNSGIIDWMVKCGGSEIDRAYGVCATQDGAFAVCGAFLSSSFTPYNATGSTGTTIVGKTLIIQNYTSFLMKYDSLGECKWAARQIGSGTSIDQAYSVASAKDGGIFVVGTTNVNGVFTVDSASVGNPKTFSSTGSIATFVAKYSATGTALWVVRIGGNSYNNFISYGDSTSICGTTDGGFAVIGYTDKVSPGYVAKAIAYNANGLEAGFLQAESTMGTRMAYIVKYDNNGTVNWMAQLGSTNNSTADIYANSVCETTDGGLCIIGNFTESFVAYNSDKTPFGTTLPPSSQNAIFVAKYSSSGNVQWVAKLSSLTGIGVGKNIVATTGGDIVISGNYTAQPFTAYHADGSAFATTITAPILGGMFDGFFAKYSYAGIVQSIARLQSPNNDIVCCMASTPSGILFVGNSSSNVSVYRPDGSQIGQNTGSDNGSSFLGRIHL